MLNENEICNEDMVNDTINVSYTIRVDDEIKCCCQTIDEVNKMVSYIINVNSVELLKKGWCNIRCISKNDKILWKVVSRNRIITQIIGNNPTYLINYDNILSEIEVEINYVI